MRLNGFAIHSRLGLERSAARLPPGVHKILSLSKFTQAILYSCMSGIFALVFSKITFSLIVILWKGLRNKGVSTLSSLSIYVFSIPVLLLLGLMALRENEVILSGAYMAIVLLWLIPVFVSNLFDVYLLKYQALTEQSSYKLAIATFLAILIDIFVFNTQYSVWILIAAFLFFIGGSILSRNKLEKIHNVPLVAVFLLVAAIAGLDVVEYALYKEGLLLQSSILFHILISQSLLFILFFILGFRKFIPDLKSRRVSVKDIVTINVLIVIYVVLEAIALKELPLVVVVSASILPLVLYSAFDFRNKELVLSYKSVLALFLVMLGIVILGML